METKDAVDCLVKVLGLLGGFWAVFNYWESATVRRAEWLFKLYKEFFDAPHFADMRRILDYEADPQHQELEGCMQGLTSNPALEEKLVDYLNFFEFVAHLWKLNRIRLREVRRLFNYYLTQLSERDYVTAYLARNDFEDLIQLLERFPRGLPIRRASAHTNEKGVAATP